MSAPRRIKKAVPGGWVFRAATGDWTYRRDGELFWRQVHLKTEQEAIQALEGESE